MDCKCNEVSNSQNSQKFAQFAQIEQELVDIARRVLKSASDPFSGVIKFLHERPENNSMPGRLVSSVLDKTFGSDEIPGLIKIMAGHVREIYRQANVIDIIKEHPTAEKWGNFVVKQKERIKFEVGLEKGRLVLSNIQGLIGVEHGVELPLEKITVVPPNLVVTVKLGMLHPQRTVAI
jgi:hypothetical protein